MFEFSDIDVEKLSGTELVATLDDVVQALCKADHVAWLHDSRENVYHRFFNVLKDEIFNRLESS